MVYLICLQSRTVPPKSLSRKRFRGQQDQPRSGLDVAALLSSRNNANKNHISTDNAIPEYKQILDAAENVDIVHDATRQLGDIIMDWIRNSFGGSMYDQALEAIRVMKEECVSLEEPAPYNDFMVDLKSKLLNEELQGDRREMWYKIRVNKLGLIEKKSSTTSDVGEEEAKKVRFCKHDRSRTWLMCLCSFYSQALDKAVRLEASADSQSEDATTFDLVPIFIESPRKPWAARRQTIDR